MQYGRTTKELHSEDMKGNNKEEYATFLHTTTITQSYFRK